jgi:predicted DNA binding CopG/RHH family protein
VSERTQDTEPTKTARPRATDKTRVTLRFDDETFEEIERRAEREGNTIAEQVRLLVEWGLEA